MAGTSPAVTALAQLFNESRSALGGILMMRSHKYNLMVRRCAAPSRTMRHRHCVAPSFETPGFAGVLRMRIQCLWKRPGCFNQSMKCTSIKIHVSVIASEAKQSRGLAPRLDCFVAALLAMTGRSLACCRCDLTCHSWRRLRAPARRLLFIRRTSHHRVSPTCDCRRLLDRATRIRADDLSSMQRTNLRAVSATILPCN